jgi:D-amino-acid dehydrogenase
MSRQFGAPNPHTVVVIGAGVVGMSCARWLQREGCKVTVVDPVPPGESCSFGNAGILAESSVTPLAMPGMIRKVPKWLLDPLGPLTIRWRYLPRLAPWLVRLLAAGRPSRIGPIAAALRALNAPSMGAYEELFGKAVFDGLVRRDGLLYVYRSDTELDADAAAWNFRRDHGVVAHRLGRHELPQFEPALDRGFACAMFVEAGGHVVDPLRVVTTLADRFRSEGGTIAPHRVKSFDVGSDGLHAVRSDGGTIAADAVVIAAGARSHELAAQFGILVPLETERGYHVTIPDSGVLPRRPISYAPGGFFATPMEMGLRIAGTVELASLDAPPDYRRARRLLDHAKRMFPGLRVDGATEWMGFRPSLPDSLPVIGATRRVPGVYFAFGHGHLGLTEAAITGKLISEMIAGRPASLDVTPYRVDRF